MEKDGNQKQLFLGFDWEASWDLQPGVQDDAGGGQGRGPGQNVPTCLQVGDNHWEEVDLENSTCFAQNSIHIRY